MQQGGRRATDSSHQGNGNFDIGEEIPINAKVHYSGVDGTCSTAPNRNFQQGEDNSHLQFNNLNYVQQPGNDHGDHETMAPRGIMPQGTPQNNSGDQHEEIPINAKVHRMGVDGNCRTDNHQGFTHMQPSYIQSNHEYENQYSHFAGGDEQYELEVDTEPHQKIVTGAKKVKAIAHQTRKGKQEQPAQPQSEFQDIPANQEPSKHPRASEDQVGKEKILVKESNSNSNSFNKTNDPPAKKYVDGILKTSVPIQFQPEGLGNFCDSATKEPSVKNVRIIEDPARERKPIDLAAKPEPEQPPVSTKNEPSIKSSQRVESRQPDPEDVSQAWQEINLPENGSTSRRSSPPKLEGPKYVVDTRPAPPIKRLSEQTQTAETKPGTKVDPAQLVAVREPNFVQGDRPETLPNSGKTEGGFNSSTPQRDERKFTSPLRANIVEKGETGISTKPITETRGVSPAKPQVNNTAQSLPKTQDASVTNAAPTSQSRHQSSERIENRPNPIPETNKTVSRPTSIREDFSEARDLRRDYSNIARAESDFRSRPQPLEPTQARKEGSIVAQAPTEVRAGSPVPSATSDYQKRFGDPDRTLGNNSASAQKGSRPLSPKSALFRNKPELSNVQRRSEEPRKETEYTSKKDADEKNTSPTKSPAHAAAAHRREEREPALVIGNQRNPSEAFQSSPTSVSKENRASSPIRVIDRVGLQDQRQMAYQPLYSLGTPAQQKQRPDPIVPQINPADIMFKPSENERASIAPVLATRAPVFSPMEQPRQFDPSIVQPRRYPSENLDSDGVEYRLGPDGNPEKIIIYGYPSNDPQVIEKLRTYSRPAKLEERFARDSLIGGSSNSNSLSALPIPQPLGFRNPYQSTAPITRPQIVQALGSQSGYQIADSRPLQGQTLNLFSGNRVTLESRSFRDSYQLNQKPLLSNDTNRAYVPLTEGHRRTESQANPLFQGSQTPIQRPLRYTLNQQ